MGIGHKNDRIGELNSFWLFSVLCLLCLCARLFICALCHLLGKGWPLGSRLWCLPVSLSLSRWYPGSGRCGTWLYRFLIFAPLLTFDLCTSTYFRQSNFVINLYRRLIANCKNISCYSSKLQILFVKTIQYGSYHRYNISKCLEYLSLCLNVCFGW